jgi:hypothetical protein
MNARAVALLGALVGAVAAAAAPTSASARVLR